MIYRVRIKKDGYSDVILVKAASVMEATGKVIQEYPEHQITDVTEDNALTYIE